MATTTGRHLATADPHGAARWLGGLPRLFWILWAGILIINRLGTMAGPFLGLYLVAVRGFSVVAAGGVLAAYALGSIVPSSWAGSWPTCAGFAALAWRALPRPRIGPAGRGNERPVAQPATTTAWSSWPTTC
jgi:hypothetical protein